MKEIKDDYLYQEGFKNYVKESLAIVECFTTLPLSKQMVCCRDILANHGPKLWLGYMTILNNAGNSGTISKIKARFLHKKMEKAYLEQYGDGDVCIPWDNKVDLELVEYFE
jgi:hypothetical protein